ncbi:M48 family metalloprotease [bacterium]|nr:M48 family metalloprotease [bacterium]
MKREKIREKIKIIFSTRGYSIAFLAILGLIFILNASSHLYASTKGLPPEIELGNKVFENIKPHLRFVENPTINSAVEGIGNRILKDLPKGYFEFRFFPIVSNDVNAFALPNGYIFVTNRLIQACDSEEELAFVLCHETAHVLRGHFMKFLSQKQKVDLATVAMMVLGAIVSRDSDLQGGLPAMSLGINQGLILSYSREQEYEADTYGLRYLGQAGYPMEGAERFMEKLRVLSQITISIPTYLSTHPMPVDRLVNLQGLKSVFPSHPSRPSTYNIERLKLWSRLESDLSIRMLGELTPAYSIDPNNLDTLYGLALVNERLGASEDAEGYYKKALVVRPNDTDVLRDYGIFLYLRGRIDEAESRLKTAIDINPEDPLAYHYFGRVMMDQKNTDKAIEAFENSQKISARFPDNYHFLGILFREKGDEEKSHKSFEQYFDITGNKKAAQIHSKKRKQEGKTEIE